eukprot:355404-Chlamydomonas_euryale.AAC.5
MEVLLAPVHINWTSVGRAFLHKVSRLALHTLLMPATWAGVQCLEVCGACSAEQPCIPNAPDQWPCIQDAPDQRPSAPNALRARWPALERVEAPWHASKQLSLADS